ncbi:MAG TPA: Holliday junction resolvase RuvX [Woeseiaceae bacterium]|nr:Holliday junction resolvase RuvX [Woeseiaceae bacterium]
MPATPDGRQPETVLAFDFGLRRIGAAVGQQITGSAGPCGVIASGAQGPDWRRIDDLVAEWRPARLIVGLPLHADGSPSTLLPAVKDFVAALERRYGLPIETVDERYSSLEARERLIERRQSGGTRRIRREMVDAAAAVLIAERWLARAGPAPGGEEPSGN